MRRLALSSLILFLVAGVAFAKPRPITQPFHVPVEQHTLSNGLRVVFSDDPNVPTVSVCMVYDVGSRLERPGKTGLAHLFEHLMFEGSKRFPKGEHERRIEGCGGSFNGFTSCDRTVYYETLPASKLATGLALEADRMKALNLNQRVFKNQLSVVQEERRERTENQAYGRHEEALRDQLYDGFGYKHPVVGYAADLQGLTLSDAKRFRREFYAPNNAVLVVVGKVGDSRAALRKVQQLFGRIPRQRTAPAPEMNEPEQTAERRQVVEDPLATVPMIDIAFKTPPGQTPDFYALDMLGDVLCSGRSSRLYRELVTKKGLAADVGAGCTASIGPGMLRIQVIPAPGKDPAAVERAVLAEIEKVQTSSVRPSELKRILTLGFAARARGLGSTSSRALELGSLVQAYGDPSRINTQHLAYGRVTPADVQRVASRYLTAARRTVVTTMPARQPQGGGRGR